MIFLAHHGMDFLALNDDVKFIISKHLQSDFKIRTMFSKYHDLQKILFGEIVFDDKFYMMIRSSYVNCKIELIENFPCNNADELICKKNQVIEKLINEIKK